MDAGTAAVVAGLGGVFLANAGQIVQPYLAERRARTQRRTDARQEAYSSLIVAMEETRLLTIVASVKMEAGQPAEGHLLESVRQRQHLEKVGLVAWVLAGTELRELIDAALTMVRESSSRAVVMDMVDGKRTAPQVDWPETTDLLAAMRRELDE